MEEKLSTQEGRAAMGSVQPMRDNKRAGTLLCLLLAAAVLGGGCTSLKSVTSPEPATAPVLRETVDSAGQASDNTIRHDTSNARVAQLWAEAERARRSGDNFEASRFILQAIEAEPTDGVLLSRAAELQLEMGQPALAESYAVRSNSLAQANRSLMLRNWMIIEYSRDVRGDLLGVRTAHRMVQQFRN